ncbi:MAG: type IX secretion system membrane protein PorP/SprF [Bacteroidetes bacterium]|nr:type IX secretion system membrane protein PorP/SprF [Bacteroidales bacterium]MBU1010139.1 type IX secretion system membrane protein PorP/SprF [Bacteroidota bacterium]
MFKKIVILFICVFTVGATDRLFAQDPAFSQFYANPLFLNPALTGSTECGRINLNYRNQWPSLSNAFVTYSASYDQSLPGINSGIGLMFMNDQQGDGAYNRTSVGGFYAYNLKVSDPVVISFGVKGAYYQEKLDWNKFIFADQINPTTGTIDPSSSETPPAKNSVTAIDFGAGLMMGYLDKLFVGVNADHLTEPNLSFYNNSDNKMPMKITAHAGTLINATEGTLGGYYDGDIMLQPNILYQQQGKFQQLNFGLYVNKYPFVAGAWFRHNFDNADAAIILLGLTWDNFRFGYSYDFTLSKLGGASGGAHEISFAWEFCVYKEPKRRTIRAISSPSF